MSQGGSRTLSVLNLEVARFECTYGRGCEGVCCREGKPLLYPDEVERLDASLPRFLAALRPEARAVLKRKGYLSRRKRYGQPVVRNAGGWCVFFNEGCVLHRAGAAEGAPFRYKPAVCALFPVQRDGRGRWYVRQKGYKGEKWDLACLDPQASAVPAAESLAGELALARRFTEVEGNSRPGNTKEIPGSEE